MTASPGARTDRRQALLARMSRPPGERAGLFPTTAAQRGLWFLDRLRPGDTAYHMPALLRLGGRLTQEQVRTALTALLARHESLRTTFVDVGGVPLQRVRPTVLPELSGVEGLDLATARAAAVALAHEPFDLARGPLVRAGLWRLSEAGDDHLLLLVVHHIVADGWSVGLMLAELDAALAGAPLPAPAPGSCPVDLALAARPSPPESVAYWADTLAGAVPTGLPARADRRPAGACAVHTVPLPEPAGARGGTEHSVHLAALAAACHRLTGRSDVVVAVPHARRHRPDVQHTVGLLVNTLPLRVRWTGDPTFAELTAIAGSVTRAALAHGEVPFDEIAPGATELMLTVDPDPLPTGRLGGLTAELLPVAPRTTKFPLTVGIDRVGGVSMLRCEYDPRRFDDDVVRGLADTMCAVLGADPGVPLSTVVTTPSVPRPVAPAAPRGATGLGAAVVETARTHPDRVAVEDDTTLTYRELVDRADVLAERLHLAHGRELGTRPVAVCARPGVDQAVGWLGVILAGGHVLPIDPDRPEDQTWVTIANADPCVLVGAAKDLGPTGVPTIELDRLAHTGGRRPDVRPARLAAVVGDGDLLVLTAAAVAHLAVAEPGQAWLHTASPASMAGVQELWRTLLSGGRRVSREADATVLSLSPHGFRARRPAGVRVVVGGVVGGIVGGVEMDLDAPPVVRVRPRPGVAVHVLDDLLRPVPVGAVGELYLSGPGTPEACFDDPGRTADRWRPSPAGDGDRLYRTGSRGVARQDGSCVVLGDPAADALLRLPGVVDAVVVTRTDPAGTPRRVAYVATEAVTSEPELRAALAGLLAEVDLPAAIVVLPRLPLDAHGEVVESALPEPPRETGAPPATDLERTVAAAWAALLDLPVTDIRRDDDFFRLGGHSLLATRLVGRLAERTGRDVPVQLVFDHPVLHAMATAVAGVTTAGEPLPVAPEGDQPLSDAQRRLWFMQSYDPASPVFNMPLAVALRGAVDVAALRAAVRGVVDRHEPLRGRVGLTEHGPVLRASDTADRFELLDLRAAPERAEAVLERAARTPFDLTAEPPLRTLLVRVADDEYRLLLLVHHIACDGWSIGVLAEEISELYAAAVAHRSPTLTEPPARYRDIVAWERSTRSGATQAAELAHWAGTLAGAPPALELPLDAPRRAVFRRRGDTVDVALPDTAAAVRRLVDEHGVTPFMVLLAAFALVLRRHTGQDDLVIGTPVTGRRRPEADRVVGCFVDVLPLRIDLTGVRSVGELLARVRAVCLTAFAHQDVPFERLVAHLAPARDLSRTPVFQVMLALQSGPPPNLALPGVLATPCAMTTGTAQHDLTLWLREDGAVTGHAEFNADILRPATVDRLVARLGATVAALATTELSEIDTMAPGELAELHDLGAGPVVPVRPGSVADLLGPVPGAREAAAALVARGVRPGDVVGVRAARSPEIVPLLVGIWLAGAAYVALDPTHPAPRQRFVAENARTRLIVTDTPAGPDLVALDEILGHRPPGPVDLPTVRGGEAAYVMYTSGSTGTPKGVVVPHRAVVNLLQAMAPHWRLTPADTVVSVTTLSFDISVLELFAPLLANAKLVVATATQAADPVLLADLLADVGATVMQATPTTWRMLVESGWRPPPGFRAWTGGEELPRDVAEALFARGVRLGNQYGPTEATIWSTVDDCVDPAEIGIGGPVANTVAYVLDDRLGLLPRGAVGELYLGGAGLADGYLGLPGRTAERFLPSPFAAGERLYRTGDLVRFGADGGLRFAGRADDQVKIRGHRVELGEVEAAMAAHPDVTAAVAAVRADRLVGYVTGMPDTAALGPWLRGFLPAHLVPDVVVAVDRVPSTPNGKVDRAALPDPVMTTPTEFVAPRPGAETTVAAVWAEVLGVAEENISAADDFFALGGHSLLATRVAARLSEITGGRTGVRDVFEHPTVAELAATLDTVTRPPTAGPATGDRPDPVPLSYAQQRLWFLHRLEGPSPTYNMPVAVGLSGPLDTDALVAAVADVVARHESLRTVFPEVDGNARQVVVDPAGLPPVCATVHVDRGALDGALVDAARHPFDLTVEIPVRARLFEVAPDDHVLLLVVHHIAGDQSSLRPFLTDLATAYRARRAGGAPAWPPLPLQYPDYAVWERATLPAQLAGHLDFWRAELADLPVRLELPADHQRAAEPTNLGDTVEFTVGPAAKAGVDVLAARCRATPFMVLQAALSVLLHRLGAGTDIPIGTPVDVRHGALDDLVGLFLNTVVLRTDTSGDPTFAELVARVRDRDLAAFDHADLPFEHLVEALNPPRVAGVHPLFQIALAYRAADDRPVALPDVEATVRNVAAGTAKFDIGVTCTEQPDGTLAGLLDYATDRFDRPTATELAERLLRVLNQALATPDRPIGTIDLLDDATRARVLTEWNDTTSGRRPTTFPEAFADRVAAGPDHTAVVCDGESLTYRELDAYANRLAGLLVRHGAGPEALVGVMLPRDVNLVVALVAVLKSGAGYLPVDPDHPAARLAATLDDARPVVVLTTGELSPLLPAGHTAVLLDAVADQPMTAAPPATPPRPGNVAYVIHTSGSTGRPKGVVVTHAGVAKLVATAVERCGVGPDSRVQQFASVSFDVAFWELCMALLVGGCLVVVPADRRVAGRPLTDYLVEHRVTHLALPPSLLAALPDDCVLPAGATVLTGAETVPAEVVARFGRDHPLFNAYGPTEATVNATLWQARAGWHGDSVPIGRPDADTKAYVLDDTMRPVPPGVVGELYLAGPGLARGYLRQPAATAAVFVPDPFGPPGGRLYRTGDLARWTAHGDLEFHGRTDDQVQIRGFRVEPGEVENALRTHPNVREAVVVAERDPVRLVAYAAPHLPGTIDVPTLRSHLAGRLPRHLLPAAIVVLAAVPRAASGKVDRARLPRPSTDREVADPPATRTEQAVAEAFCEVLGLTAVGRHDEFFELGGHSLQIPKVVAAIAARTGAEVPLRDVFLAPTVAGVASVVDDNRAAPAPIQAVDRGTRRRNRGQA